MNLKQYRQLARMTQVELANKLNVTRHTIYRWEHGLYQPSEKMKKNIKEILETEEITWNN